MLPITDSHLGGIHTGSGEPAPAGVNRPAQYPKAQANQIGGNELGGTSESLMNENLRHTDVGLRAVVYLALAAKPTSMNFHQPRQSCRLLVKPSTSQISEPLMGNALIKNSFKIVKHGERSTLVLGQWDWGPRPHLGKGGSVPLQVHPAPM